MTEDVARDDAQVDLPGRLAVPLRRVGAKPPDNQRGRHTDDDSGKREPEQHVRDVAVDEQGHGRDDTQGDCQHCERPGGIALVGQR